MRNGPYCPGNPSETFFGYAATVYKSLSPQYSAAFGVLTGITGKAVFGNIGAEHATEFVVSLGTLRDADAINELMKLWGVYQDFVRDSYEPATPAFKARLEALRAYLEDPFEFSGRWFQRNQVSRPELRNGPLLNLLGGTRSQRSRIITELMKQFPGWILLPTKQSHQSSGPIVVYRRITALWGSPTPVDAPPIVDTIEPARDIATAPRKRFEL